MDKFIFVFEDGIPYSSSELKPEDLQAVDDGLLSIIRCSDGKYLERDGVLNLKTQEWKELPIWPRE